MEPKWLRLTYALDAGSAPLARIEQVPHGIAKQVRAEYDETDR